MMTLMIVLAFACILGTGAIQFFNWRDDLECDWVSYWITFFISIVAYVGWGVSVLND